MSVTLFTPPEELDRHQATREFIRLFKEQLRTCKDRKERRELQLAIRSYEASLEPPKPARK